MTPLQEWARRHGISPIAVADLQRSVLGTFNVSDPLPNKFGNTSESALQQRVRMRASAQGRRMWRNNVGVAFRDDGVPIRFGLANDSPKIHDTHRSSDLIGITPMIIRPEDVGYKFGLFTSWEIKKPGWVFNPKDKHQAAQHNWNNLVCSLGGDGRFITSEQEI